MTTEDRLTEVEEKLTFIFSILAMTKRTPDGTTTSSPMGVLYKEHQAHAQRLAHPVAQSNPGPDPDGRENRIVAGPDGFSG